MCSFSSCMDANMVYRFGDPNDLQEMKSERTSFSNVHSSKNVFSFNVSGGSHISVGEMALEF